MDDDNSLERRNSSRKFVNTELDVNIDTDNLEATSVNLSDTGICFDTQTPLHIDVKFVVEGESRTHTGRLIWAKKKEDGSFTYAFEYVK